MTDLLHNLGVGTVILAEGGIQYTVAEKQDHLYHNLAPDGSVYVVDDTGSPDWLAVDDIESVVSTPNAPVADTWNVALAKLAAEHGKTITFRYAKRRDGSIIEGRRLEVDHVATARDGAQLLVGNDPDRQDVRAFRVDRIKGDVSA